MESKCRAHFFEPIMTITFKVKLSTSLIFFDCNRRTFSKEEYERLKKGELPDIFQTIIVDTAVCARPLLEPSKFSRANHYHLKFNSQWTQIQLFPRDQAVFIRSQTIEPFNIPNDYKYYYYSVKANVYLTNEAIDFILTCEKAETIIFDDSGDLASRFLHRIDQWENMTNLRSLSISISKYEVKPELREYFRRFPALQIFSIKFSVDLSSNDIDTYLEGQSIPNAWERHDSNQVNIHFHRKY